MKRLSLEELKAQKNVVANLDAIKGGNTTCCHPCGCCNPPCDRPCCDK